MNRANLCSLAAVGGAIVFLCANTTGALNAYMSIKGQKQGVIVGGVTQKGRDGKIMVIAYNHEVASPRDAASGLPTGKVQHKPLEVTVEWDIATPKLYTALLTNETLPEVTIDFWTPQLMSAVGGTGAEVQYMTVKLTNASIAYIRSRMLNNKNPELTRYKEFAEIGFTYQKIEITNKTNGTTATGSWGGPGGLLALLDPPKAQPKTTLTLH